MSSAQRIGNACATYGGENPSRVRSGSIGVEGTRIIIFCDLIWHKRPWKQLWHHLSWLRPIASCPEQSIAERLWTKNLFKVWIKLKPWKVRRWFSWNTSFPISYQIVFHHKFSPRYVCGILWILLLLHCLFIFCIFLWLLFFRSPTHPEGWVE